MLIAESPSLCDPHCVRVSRRDGRVDGLSVFGKYSVLSFDVILIYGQSHLVEAVREVKVGFSEFLFPLLYEKFSYFLEVRRIRGKDAGIVFGRESSPSEKGRSGIRMSLKECRRHEACEGRSYRLHTHSAHFL